MKRIFCALVILCVMVSCAYAAYYDESNDGDSWETAYVIDSVEDFTLMRDRVNNGTEASGKYYKLNADIDITSQTGWIGIGSYYEGRSDFINPFRGHFDGQGHSVRISSLSNNVFAGVFFTVSSDNTQSAVRDLNVAGNVIADCAGTVVHYLLSGTVENCSFTGTIMPFSSSSQYGAGGLIAHVEGGTVKNCRVSADISGGSYAGGIIGEMTGGYITGCTARVNLTCDSGDKGGIVGQASRIGLASNLSGNTWQDIYPQIGNYPDAPTTADNISIEWNSHKYTVFNLTMTWDEEKHTASHSADIWRQSQAKRSRILSRL